MVSEVAGDSRVVDMAYVDKEGKVGEGSLGMLCEERAWGLGRGL